MSSRSSAARASSRSPRRVVGAVLYVSDLASSLRFYRDRLGFQVRVETSERAVLRGDGCDLVLSRRWWPPTLSGVHPFATTPCVESHDVDVETKALEGAGVRVLMRPTPFPDGSAIAEVLDPDGNVVRLAGKARRRDKGAWGKGGRRSSR